MKIKKCKNGDYLSTSKIGYYVLFACFTIGLIGCFWKQDRTTTVYGSVTDLNQQPVDSVMLLIQGAEGTKYDNLKEVYSDSTGHYEAVVEASKSHSALIIVIPYFRNPHYVDHYSGLIVKKNDVETTECCYAGIGDKTKYDFQLNPL